MMGSQEDGVGLLDPIFEGHNGRELEGHFRRIDLMGLSVVKPYLHVHDRKTGEDAGLHCLDDSLFNSRDKTSRYVHPGQGVFKFIPGPARKRRDVDVDLRKLAAAARLFLMAVDDAGLRPTDRFLVRDLGNAEVHFDAEFPFSTFRR